MLLKPPDKNKAWKRFSYTVQTETDEGYTPNFGAEEYREESLKGVIAYCEVLKKRAFF
jgi:hypothetical protein